METSAEGWFHRGIPPWCGCGLEVPACGWPEASCYMIAGYQVTGQVTDCTSGKRQATSGKNQRLSHHPAKTNSQDTKTPGRYAAGGLAAWRGVGYNRFARM
jgi:hypothetical protein